MLVVYVQHRRSDKVGKFGLAAAPTATRQNAQDAGLHEGRCVDMAVTERHQGILPG